MRLRTSGVQPARCFQGFLRTQGVAGGSLTAVRDLFVLSVSAMAIDSAPRKHGGSSGGWRNIDAHTSNVGCSLPVLRILTLEVYPAMGDSEVGASITCTGASLTTLQHAHGPLEARIALVPPSTYYPNQSSCLHSHRPSARHVRPSVVSSSRRTSADTQTFPTMH